MLHKIGHSLDGVLYLTSNLAEYVILYTVQHYNFYFQLYQDEINKFGDKYYPIPPSRLISVYGSPDAVPILDYSIPLVGVVRPVSLYIRRSRRTSNR